MVRILAGINSHHANALELLERLRFASAEVHLLHVVESLLPDKSFPNLGPNHPLAELMEEKKREGEAELAKAATRLASTDYRIETATAQGDPSRRLIEAASQWPADLVAVGSAQKGHWGSLFFGSVTKALTAAAESSILIAKRPPRPEAEFAAVLATDHSPYADACVDRLLAWKATGIRRITVLTANPMVLAAPIGPAETASATEPSMPGEIVEDLHRRNADLCRRLGDEGYESESVVLESTPQEAIAQTMEDAQADLLIVGARGHGFWDRLRLGSVSHYQVVATPHNVLVIRN